MKNVTIIKGHIMSFVRNIYFYVPVLFTFRFNKVKERSETMTAEEVEEIMRKKITESFQVSL